MPRRKLVLDSNCFIEASRGDAANAAYEVFTAQAAPRLYLSSVVAAELRAGAINSADWRSLEGDVFGPYLKRGRVVTPSSRAWDALGSTLGTLVSKDGLQLKTTPRSFIFDILIAYSCREIGAILVSANLRDLSRIARVFSFDYVAPFPDPAMV
ncbi:MAG: type II toxin-antitoxin system VapC family toxin [Gemmatimonadales bacterium]